MPVEMSTHKHGVTSAFMWGLLPDNEKVIARWASDYHVSPRNAFALLAHVGEECAGAVQFVQPERVDEAAAGGHVEWLEPHEVAARIRLLRVDPTAWHAELHHGQFSLAGAQAKIALLRDGMRWGRPSGRIPTTHILKPAIEGFDDHDLNEHLCLRAARLLGLRAAPTEVVEFDDERAIVVERYDRVRGKECVFRVHQEDLCQAFGIPPTKEYQNEGGPTPASIVRLLREVDPEGAASSERAFLDALIFNWLIAGTDAHAKNYSLLLSGRQVRLAPLYDVASALPYPHLDRRRLRLAMTVGGEYRLDWIVGRHWQKLAEELRLEAEMLLRRASELAEGIGGAFATAAHEPAVRALDSSLPDELTRAVSARASECTRSLRSA